MLHIYAAIGSAGSRTDFHAIVTVYKKGIKIYIIVVNFYYFYRYEEKK